TPAPNSLASAAARSASRSTIVTRAPRDTSMRTVASPNPEAPPVTSADAPSIFMACASFRLVVLLLGIRGPHAGLIRNAGHNIIHRNHRGQHGVILIIVLVHTVAPDQEKVGEAVYVLADHVKAVISSKVG